MSKVPSDVTAALVVVVARQPVGVGAVEARGRTQGGCAEQRSGPVSPRHAFKAKTSSFGNRRPAPKVRCSEGGHVQLCRFFALVRWRVHQGKVTHCPPEKNRVPPTTSTYSRDSWGRFYEIESSLFSVTENELWDEADEFVERTAPRATGVPEPVSDLQVLPFAAPLCSPDVPQLRISHDSAA